ncbi:MAG TPA: hypothetical protein VFR73_11785 [Hyphomicrobiaceae bacterium]|jgi:hypothetical protein|nr:hypothetical protein [Hyphomicrobiaceae bacterium]
MAAKAKRGKSKPGGERKLDRQLDEALTDTFPASDPIAVGHFTATEPPARPVDRKAPVIDLEDVAAARRQRRG